MNADDFGASAAVNEGVRRGHIEGVVTSASLLATGEALAEAVALADDLPTLAVGAHLALCDGRAVVTRAEAPSLVDDRGFLPADARAFVARFLAGRLRLADIRAELAAQLGRLADAGMRLSHADSHQHLHHLPGVADVVLDLARRFGLRAVRCARAGLWPARRGWLARQLLLRLCAESFGVAAGRAGFVTPDGFLGQAEAGRLKAASLVKMVERLGEGTWELAVHPAAPPDDGAPAGYDRPGELAAVCALEVREVVRRRRVRLVNYHAL